jgi:hypothetical protein
VKIDVDKNPGVFSQIAKMTGSQSIPTAERACGSEGAAGGGDEATDQFDHRRDLCG